MNSLTGGLYISQGNDGCVYHPNFASNKYPSNDKLISKIIIKGSPNNELENVSKLGLDKLDKAHNFLLLPKDIDDFKDNTITLNTLVDCPLITKAIHKDEDLVLFLNENYDNLIVDYGGKSLNLYRNNSVNVLEDKLVDYLNLMMGVLLMNSNGIIHRGIKPSHITTEPIMKFIDFGLATNNYDFSSATHRISKNTPYWPLEYHLLQPDFYNKHIKIVDNTSKKVDKVIYCINLIDTLIRNNYINNTHGKILSPSELGVFYDKYIHIAVSIFISKDIDIDALRTICLDKFDTFSLGVVLANELRIISSDSKLHKDIISEINYIFNNMIEPNPEIRTNIIDIIAEYLYILYSNELIDNDFYNETIKKIRDISGFNILNFGELQDILIN